MKLIRQYSYLVLLVVLVSTQQSKAQYNTMWIPDTLSGTTFNLDIKDTFSQIVNTGNQTITGGINNRTNLATKHLLYRSLYH